MIMNSVITYVDQEPEPVPEPPPPPPKPVRVDIAGGSFGYATVMVSDMHRFSLIVLTIVTVGRSKRYSC